MRAAFLARRTAERRGKMRTTIEQDIAISAIRCCHAARSRGEDNVLPCLYAALESHGCGLLAPAFLGLVEACEYCMGRDFCPGSAERFSADECQILALLDDPAHGGISFAHGPHARSGLELLVSAAASTSFLIERECAGPANRSSAPGHPSR